METRSHKFFTHIHRSHYQLEFCTEVLQSLAYALLCLKLVVIFSSVCGWKLEIKHIIFFWSEFKNQESTVK